MKILSWLRYQAGLMLQNEAYYYAALFCAGVIVGILIVRLFQ